MDKSVALLSFVVRVGNQFMLEGRPFYVNGWNSYWLMVNAADESTRSRVDKVMRDGSLLGFTLCRTWAFNDDIYQALQLTPGHYDERVFQALDYVIFQAQCNGVRVLLSLVNTWKDYGGRAKYISWAQDAGEKVTSDDDFFSNSKCRQYYKDHVKAILTRVNTFTKVEYRQDPAIFGWELINEPQCPSDSSGNKLQAWIEEMAMYLKSLDPQHLLTVGTEGFYSSNSKGRSSSNPNSYAGTVGTDFIRNHQLPGIDFATVHAYPDSWLSTENVDDKLEFFKSWVSAHIEDAEKILGMPVLFTEFGLSDKSPGYTMDKREAFYSIVYDQVYQSAQNKGAGAGCLQWQLLPPEMDDWNDGFGIDPASYLPITNLMTHQSSRLRLIHKPLCTPEEMIQAENDNKTHKHSITKVFKGLSCHIFK